MRAVVWGVVCLAWALLVGGGLFLAGVFPDPLRPEREPLAERARPRDVPARSVTALPPGSLSWRFERDDAGRVSRTVDPAGRATRFQREFDAQGGLRRLVKELAGGSRVVFTYDGSGRRLSRQDAAGTVRYEYDDEGRLTSVSRPGGAALTYTYDAQGRLQSLALGNGLRIGYAYDFLGRLERIDTPAGAITYDYVTGASQTVRRLPNGIRTVRQYHPSGRLESIMHAGADNLVLARFTYAYRPDGLIREAKEWTRQGERVVTYEYDTVQRLAAVTDARAGKVCYGYDRLGNRTERTGPGGEKITSTCDWAGRLQRLNGKKCGHDAVGNLVAYTGSRGKVRFDFSPANCLQTARVNGATVQYQYDGDDNLVARIIGKEKTVYVPDPAGTFWRPLLATDAAGKSTLYVWEGETLLAALSGGEARFFLHDHLGSVRQHADRQGKVVASCAYRAFGAPVNELPAGGLQPGFAGLFYDPQAGLYLARARAYDPALGRWLQRLPPDQRVPASAADLSPYAYCGNDPVNGVDPEGKHPHSGFQEEPEL